MAKAMQMPVVVSVKKKELNRRGIDNFNEWNSLPGTLYIGRGTWVPGTTRSKWCNPFKVQKGDRGSSLTEYRKYLLSSPHLMDALGELSGKELGCWCKTAESSIPVSCHGDVLVEAFNAKFKTC